MGKSGHRLGALLIVGTLGAGMSHAADSPGQSAVIDRGAYLATAADCGACHTAPSGKPFAGGLPISTPLGTIYSTNITPSADFGILEPGPICTRAVLRNVDGIKSTHPLAPSAKQ